jgi:hypothetical protein
VRQAVWYWARIIVQTTPTHVAWWPDAEHLDAEPMRWSAPTGTTFPRSDAPPAGPPTPPSAWPTPSDWRPRAHEVLEQHLAGHLTVCDREGFPLPFKMRAVALVDDGFALDVPRGAPWKPVGPASLCFSGRGTFVGQVSPTADGAHFAVERRLPDLPLMADPAQLWTPQPETKNNLMERLENELTRRGLTLPHVPDEPPGPTEGSLLRTQATTPNHRPAIPLKTT